MTAQALVVGVGMIPFAKPGASESYDVMGAKAATAALNDAGIGYDKIQQAYVGYVYGDSTAGQSALYPVGLSGIPIINVNNNCSTGSTALFLARQAVASGVVDCALALGFEQMPPGALGAFFPDRKPLSSSAARAGNTPKRTERRPRPSPRSPKKRAAMRAKTPSPSSAIR